MDMNNGLATAAGTRIVVDIGSTVVKIARVAVDGALVAQEFHPRDFDAGIASQVESLLDALGPAGARDDVLVCSSANGGLRVGIVCLTERFSGATTRSQVLVAGANPVFMHTLGEDKTHAGYVDMLLVTGGIDCEDAGPLAARLERLTLENYRFGTLVYAGNRYLADLFLRRFPGASVIPNPISDSLAGKTASVFDAVRRAYLDDLVYKEGVSELRGSLAQGIRPTPEIVNRGFHRAITNASNIQIVGACLLLDVGGATTDLHYTVEVLRDESQQKPLPGLSVARYVFTDLGIVASRESLLLQMRTHPRLYEMLATVVDGEVAETYQALREGTLEPPATLPSYGCIFLALDRFAEGRGPGLPVAELGKLAQIILTGGAVQSLDEEMIGRIAALVMPEGSAKPVVLVDRRYQIWVDGITWDGLDPARSA